MLTSSRKPSSNPRSRVSVLYAKLTIIALFAAGIVISPAELLPVQAAPADPSVGVTIEGAIGIGVAKPVSVAVAGFPDGNYQATVKLVDASGQDNPNGTFAQSATDGLSSVAGFSLSNGAKLGFAGTLASVEAALATLTWTPAFAGTGQIVQVTLASQAGANKFYSSATGRYYEYVPSSGISWEAARNAAAGKELFGLKGYLVHITSAAENEFIANETTATNIWIGTTDGTLGPSPAFAITETANADEGKWRWGGVEHLVGVTIAADEPKFNGSTRGTYYAKYNTRGNSVPDELADGYEDWPLTPPGGTTVTIPYAGWAIGEPNDSPSEDCAVTNWSGSKGRWNDLSCTTSQASGYLVEYGGRSDDGAASSAVTKTAEASFTVIASVPSAPVVSSITEGDQQLTVTFTQGSDGGASISNYAYSTDGGVTFTELSPPDTTSPITITTVSTNGTTALENGTSYSVMIRAVNSEGSSAPTTAVSVIPSTVPQAPVISGVSPGDQVLSVSFTPSANGGRAITNYEYSTDGVNYLALSPAQTTSPIVIRFLSEDGTTALVNGTPYTVTLRAVNIKGESLSSAAVISTPAVPVEPATSGPVVPPVTPTVTPLAPRPPQLVTLPIEPSIQTGPVLRNNQASPPPVAPTGFVNGVPTPVSSLVTDPTQLNLRTGVLNIAVNVNPQQGLVRQGTGGETEVQVRSGGTTALSGSGLAPRSTVQVFMPLQGGNAKELARIPVDANGSFSGDAVFATGLQDAPIPVGRHTLQMVTIDELGRQTVLEFTVNIAQPGPAPELNRQSGGTPQLLPGQSLATNAGIPEVVQVTAVPDQKQTVIEGDGWVMAVDVNNPDASVEETDDGGVLLKLVRDEPAQVSGSGFMPGTRADVWLFSDPTLLGTVEIDENGSFSGSVTIDGKVVAVGNHTLQLQGVGMDGYVRAANLGVIVGDEQAVATQEQAQSLLWLLWVALIALGLGGGIYAFFRTDRGQALWNQLTRKTRTQ